MENKKLDFSQFDREDLSKYKAEMESANQNEYKEVPVGTYFVEIEKLELTISKSNKPMGVVWMNILEGEFKGSKLFWNQTINTPFGGAKFRDFLRALDSGQEVVFESFSQFAELVLDVHEAISDKLEYEVKYSVNKNGFADYKITGVFDK